MNLWGFFTEYFGLFSPRLPVAHSNIQVDTFKTQSFTNTQLNSASDHDVNNQLTASLAQKVMLTIGRKFPPWKRNERNDDENGDSGNDDGGGGDDDDDNDDGGVDMTMITMTGTTTTTV